MKTSVMFSIDLHFDPQSVAQGYVDTMNRVLGTVPLSIFDDPPAPVTAFDIREPTEEEIDQARKNWTLDRSPVLNIIDLVKVDNHWESHPKGKFAKEGVKKRVMILEMDLQLARYMSKNAVKLLEEGEE